MSSFQEEIKSILKDSTRDIKVTENLEAFRQVLSEENKRKSYKFVRTMLFPEFSKGARYPGRFQSPSGIYNLFSEFLVTTTPNNCLGLMIRPHAGINEGLLYNFAGATMQNWGQGVSQKSYNTESESPSVPPETFFRSHRLIGCSVTVEGISEEASGILKSGVEYDVSESFYKSAIGDNRTMASLMLSNAVQQTALYKLGTYLRKLFKDRYGEARFNNTRFGSITVEFVRTGALDAVYTGDNYPIITAAQILGLVPAQFDVRGAGAAPASIYRSILDSDSTDPPVQMAMKAWRTWWKAPITGDIGTRLIHNLLYQSMVGSNWPVPSIPRNNFAGLAGEELDFLLQNIGMVMGALSEVSENSIEFQARLAMRNATSTLNNIDSETVSSPPLNFGRMQLLSYRQETYYDMGIRMVYVPQNPDIKYDRFPMDLMYIGGIALPRAAPIRIRIVRHFEGLAYNGIGKLFSIASESENEEALTQINMIIKKYPGILKIPPKELKAVYEKCKKSFKWIDLSIKETSAGFAMIKDRMESVEIGDLHVPYLEEGSFNS
ncbi:MAG: hypothetical protein ACKOW9_02670 [Candidatus Paceibacterota bacterium]